MIFNVAPVVLQNQLSSETPDLANQGVKDPLMNEIRCFTADLGQKTYSYDDSQGAGLRITQESQMHQ